MYKGVKKFSLEDKHLYLNSVKVNIGFNLDLRVITDF